MASKPLISPTTMRSLRALDERAMPDSATLRRPTPPIPNGRGGTIPSAPITLPLQGRFSHGTGDGVGQQGPFEDERAELIRRGATARYKIAVGEDVRETDQIDVAGLRYDVVYAPPPTGYSTSRLIGLKLVGPAT